VKYQNFGVFFLGYKKYVLLPVSFLNNNFWLGSLNGKFLLNNIVNYKKLYFYSQFKEIVKLKNYINFLNNYKKSVLKNFKFFSLLSFQKEKVTARFFFFKLRLKNFIICTHFFYNLIFVTPLIFNLKRNIALSAFYVECYYSLFLNFFSFYITNLILSSLLKNRRSRPRLDKTPFVIKLTKFIH
jgi:hypothetical protein